jgi:SpoIID/LytB domain
VDRSGRLAAINQVAAEKLLEGLVPAEIYASSPPETLKAQAVTARGELLAKIGLRHLADPYLICSDQHCQVYRGVGHEDPRTSAAVAATKGRMLFRGERLVDAVYSASCGGHTEHNEQAWEQEPDPALRGLRDDASQSREEPVTDVARFLEEPSDAWCRKSSKGASSFRWEKRIPADELRARVTKRQDIGRILELRILARGVSGRARTLEIVGEGGTVRVERELPIRQLLGSLKSALFVVEAVEGDDGVPREFVIRGGGFGHGVGMCQNGAIGQGEAGRAYADILRHYYQGSHGSNRSIDGPRPWGAPPGSGSRQAGPLPKRGVPETSHPGTVARRCQGAFATNEAQGTTTCFACLRSMVTSFARARETGLAPPCLARPRAPSLTVTET